MNINYGVFALRDKVEKNFRSITIDSSDATARRNFSYAVKNSDWMMFTAKDLELWKIGEFDSSTGEIRPVIPMQMVCKAEEVIGDDK